MVICRELIGTPPAHGLLDYVLYITTFRFYVSHDAPWFIAAIIPMYLLSPLLFFLIEKFKWYAATIVVIVMWAFLFITIPSSFELISTILDNIQFVSVRATSFVFGMAFGQSIKSENHIRLPYLVALASIGVLVVVLSRHLVYGYFFFALPVLCLMVKVLNKCNFLLRSISGFMGKISLESYILNGALPSMMITLFAAAGIPSWKNLLPYVAACVIGTALGWICHMVSYAILKNNFLHIQ